MLVRRAYDEADPSWHVPRVPQLKAAIREFIAAHQANPKPFVWSKSADQILGSIARFAQRTVDAQAAQQMSRTTVTAH
jgi:hypothetical protein